MFALDVDTAGLTAIADRLSATEEQVERARAAALQQTEEVFTRGLLRYVCKKARIPRRGLARRLFSNRSADNELLKVWVGASPISPGKIGTPQVYAGGVRVGRRKFPGAFLGDVYSTGANKIWIRLRSKHYDRELYPTIYRAGDRGMARDGRFPVVRAAIPVEEYMGEFIRRNSSGLAESFLASFGSALRQEVGRG